MSAELHYRHSQFEAPAPVGGGMRWRSRYHDFIDYAHNHGCTVINNPDEPAENCPLTAEPEPVSGPNLISVPPVEARAGVTYSYQAKAHDSTVNGFTWYFEKRPAGMAVDRYTGLVTWIPSEGGYVEAVLCARTLYGTTARQSWTICVRKARNIRPVITNPRYQAALRRKTPWTTPSRQPVWRCGASANRNRRSAFRPLSLFSIRTTAPPAVSPAAAPPLRL